ncbi:MAG: phosphopantetheine-binding protein [Chlamydiales bacterium]|nr:phosphopantetheine-binding protein [Chlamydiales bacterium]
MEARTKVRDFIKKNLVDFDEKAQIADSDNIFALGFVNSLFAMKLLNFVESEFNTSVEPEDMSLVNFSSVDNIVQLIDRKCS